MFYTYAWTIAIYSILDDSIPAMFSCPSCTSPHIRLHEFNYFLVLWRVLLNVYIICDSWIPLKWPSKITSRTTLVVGPLGSVFSAGSTQLGNIFTTCQDSLNGKQSCMLTYHLLNKENAQTLCYLQALDL